MKVSILYFLFGGLVASLTGCVAENNYSHEWTDNPSPGGAYMYQTLNSSVFEDPSPARDQADSQEWIAEEQNRKAEANH